jgi:hypothetical protein
MNPGDVVRVKSYDGRYKGGAYVWHEFVGKVGVVISMGKRLHIPAAKVLVKGEVADFDLDELEKV